MKSIQRRRPAHVLALALAALGVMVAAQIALATHPRPKGATPLRVSLVPAYTQCTAPNRTHGPPLGFPSCAPPVQESSFLTVGTPDANGAGANSVGSVTLSVRQTSTEQLAVSFSVSDVRCRPATNAAVCSGANAADGPDYSGELEGNATIRISDHYNGENLDEAATVQDIPLPLYAPCVNTADTSTGGLCDSKFAPQPLIPPQDFGGRRTVVEVTQVQVFDGGADGAVSTSPNTLFMNQGIFIP